MMDRIRFFYLSSKKQIYFLCENVYTEIRKAKKIAIEAKLNLLAKFIEALLDGVLKLQLS